MKKMYAKISSGFSLIELLVVISIIAILSAIAVVAYSNAQVQARDAQRVGDMKAIQDAFEQFYVENGTYAVGCAGMYASLQGGAAPTDPQGSAYFGVSGCTASSYCICADVETDTKGNSTSNACAFAAASTTHYCVQNLQ